MRNVLGAVLCLYAPSALAEKICFTPFKGPGAEIVRDQLSQSVCSNATCVNSGKVTKGGKPDWAKAKKEGIDFFVTGTIKAKGKKRTLDLQVLANKKPKLKKVFTFTGNDLPDATLKAALGALEKTMGLNEKAAEAPPKEEPKKEPEPAKEEPKKDEEAPAEAPAPKEGRRRKEPSEPPPAPKEEERETPKEEEPAPEEEVKVVKPPICCVEGGVELFSRNFSYNQPETNNLRSYSAGLIVAPGARAEIYPLALFNKGILSGIGFEGSFGISVGLKSRRSGTDEVWPTTILNYDFAVRFRFRPVKSVDAAIIAFVGYQNRSFAVSPGTLGTVLDGLPNTSYAAIRPGLAGELPFSNSGFMIFARFAPLIVLSNGQIIGPTGFFHAGSNFGIEGSLGAGYRIFGPLSIRLSFDFVRYGLGFVTVSTDTYRAGGAVDTYLGGNLGVRVCF